MKNKKHFIILIVCAIVILLIISIILLLLIKETKEDSKFNIESESGLYTDYENDYDFEGQLKDASNDSINETQYFITKYCITKYLKVINPENFYFMDEEGNYIVNKELMQEPIVDMLSKRYINRNNITKDNVLNVVKTLSGSNNYVPIEIKKIEDNNVSYYIVHGVIVGSLDYALKDEVFFIVGLDTSNQLFSIEPISKKEYDKVDVETLDKKIEDNTNNKFYIKLIDKTDILPEYTENYKTLSIVAPEMMYDKFDEEYREARFGTLSEFKKYVADNKEDIMEIRGASYLTEEKNGCTDYVIKDQYDNLYIFSEKSVLDYTVKLDTYTLPTEKFKTSYKTMSNKDKVATNIDRFFQMLNSNDFSAAYSVLNEGFKNTYFPTVDSFEKFMKENVYTHAKVRYIDFSDEISGIYTYRIELSNKKNTEDKPIIMNIIMQLQEGYDYTISFEVLR